MPGERRGDEDVRRQIATEREQLAEALADLRRGVAEKRRPAALTGGALAAGFVATVAIRVARRLRGR